MHAELKHTEDDGRLEGVVSPHLVQYVTTDLKTFENSIIDLSVLTWHTSWFVVDELDKESSVAVVVELEVAVLEDLTVVALRICTLDHVVSLHVDELD